MQITYFILDKILKLLTCLLHAFLSLVVAKLSDLKNSPNFWPTTITKHYSSLCRQNVL